MAKDLLTKEEKEAELKKYYDLVIATIDYYLDNSLIKLETADFNSVQYFNSLKIHAENDYKKGRLTRLKQCFRDMTEMQIETKDFKFNSYLQKKTNYKIDIFESYFQRIDKIIEKGKIATDSQFYDISSLVNQLSETAPLNENRIELLNRLLVDYEKRKKR